MAGARAFLKFVSLAVGFVTTLFSLMALVGALTDNGWARVLVGLLVALAVPAVLADRLLPSEPDERSKGLVGDVFAVVWLVVPVLFVVVLGSVTRPLMASEADRLKAGGFDLASRGAYTLARVSAVAPSTEASATPSAGPSSSAALPSASALLIESSSAGPAPSASPSAGAAPIAPAPSQGNATAAELFKKLAPAVVTLRIKGQGGGGGGTGFLIDRDGTVVTNYHVIEDARECTIKTFNGALYEEVWVLAEDPAADLALLKIDLSKPKEGAAGEFTPLVLGDSDKVEVGEPVFVIGNPLGLEHTLTTGIVSARRLYENKRWIQMSAPISPGNSGGPVFDGKGTTIGVATAAIQAYGHAQNLNLAVPIDQVRAVIKPDYPAKRKLGSSAAGGKW